jgi:hypothetical protein
MLRLTIASLIVIGLVGCQNLPQQTIEQPKTVVTPEEPSKPKEIHTPTGVVIKPYDREEIQRQQLPPPTVVIPQQQKKTQVFNDGSELPAYKNLVQQAEKSLKQNQIANAENLMLQAQRLAPQAAQTYVMLAKISLAKNDKANARALAQRGLSFAQNDSIKNQLNQIIQQSK